MEQPGHEPVSKWDASTARSGLTIEATAPKCASLICHSPTHNNNHLISDSLPVQQQTPEPCGHGGHRQCPYSVRNSYLGQSKSNPGPIFLTRTDLTVTTHLTATVLQLDQISGNLISQFSCFVRNLNLLMTKVQQLVHAADKGDILVWQTDSISFSFFLKKLTCKAEIQRQREKYLPSIGSLPQNSPQQSQVWARPKLGAGH